jgi:hypothetical protein
MLIISRYEKVYLVLHVPVLRCSNFLPTSISAHIVYIMSAISISSAFASANRGPLTTIFTPPASCLSETTLVSFLTTVSPTSSGFTTTKIFINHFSWGDAACYPSTIATISGSTRWNNGYYYCESPRQS